MGQAIAAIRPYAGPLYRHPFFCTTGAHDQTHVTHNEDQPLNFFGMSYVKVVSMWVLFATAAVSAAE